MKKLLPIAIALLIAGFGELPFGSADATEATAAAAPGTFEAEPAHTAAEAELVAEVHARFADHGLELPADLAIGFHDDATACNGNYGRFEPAAPGPRVRVCWTHENPGVELVLRRQALVHEAAHAWAYDQLDDATRIAFVELTGSDSWNESTSDWQLRGTERAAELITWAVLDPAVLFLETDGVDCQVWQDAYQLLTGHEAPPALAECS